MPMRLLLGNYTTKWNKDGIAAATGQDGVIEYMPDMIYYEKRYRNSLHLSEG